MLIPATRISPYLDMVCKALGPLPSSTHSIRVQFKSGALWRMATPAEVQALANEQQVFGTGSASKLKYVSLDVAPEVAEATLDRRVRPASRQVLPTSTSPSAVPSLVRERLKNSQASQTVINQPIAGARGTFKAFKHVRNRHFGLKSRQEYQ